MPLKVLIVPDKFKGTLTALEAADAIARGWQSKRPQDQLDLLPMSDGGDGFGETLSRLLGAEPRRVETVDAAGRSIEAVWWWHSVTRLAIVESARVIGLAMLPPGRFRPIELDTYGLGLLLRSVAAEGAARCLIGIGGSATNDGGFGLARALDWQFLRGDGSAITHWADLAGLAAVRPPEAPCLFDELIAAVDVQNPLLGTTGCSRVYGPQKGLVDVDAADRALGQLAAVVAEQNGVGHELTPGAGAGGGIGFGLMAFAGARLESGFTVFKTYAQLEDRMRRVQLVITGEGAIDDQTLMGKGVGEIARLSARLGVPCLGVAGSIAYRELVRNEFDATYAMTPDLTDSASALREPAMWLERAAARAAHDVVEDKPPSQ